MILTAKTFTVAWGRKTGKETLMMQQEMGCKQGKESSSGSISTLRLSVTLLEREKEKKMQHSKTP